jgi:hypothetical protein
MVFLRNDEEGVKRWSFRVGAQQLGHEKTKTGFLPAIRQENIIIITIMLSALIAGTKKKIGTMKRLGRKVGIVVIMQEEGMEEKEDLKEENLDHPEYTHIKVCMVRHSQEEQEQRATVISEVPLIIMGKEWIIVIVIIIVVEEH